MNGRQHPSELVGIKPPVSGQDVDPLVDPHVSAADVRDHGAVDGTYDGWHGYPGRTHDILVPRVELRVLNRNRKVRMLDRKATASSDQLPDFTQTPECHGTVQTSGLSQPESFGDQTGVCKVKHEPTVRGDTRGNGLAKRASFRRLPDARI